MKVKTRNIKSIKLFGKIYAVRFVDGEDWSMNGVDGNYQGRVDHGTQQILIKDRLSDEQLLDTLLHEIAHIIGVEMGMGLSEAEVTQWATALTDLFLSNDWKS